MDSVDSKSLTAIMLRMWLGDLEQNSLSVLLGSNLQVSADWLFLALSAMGRSSSILSGTVRSINIYNRGEKVLGMRCTCICDAFAPEG